MKCFLSYAFSASCREQHTSFVRTNTHACTHNAIICDGMNFEICSFFTAKTLVIDPISSNKQTIRIECLDNGQNTHQLNAFVHVYKTIFITFSSHSQLRTLLFYCPTEPFLYVKLLLLHILLDSSLVRSFAALTTDVVAMAHSHECPFFPLFLSSLNFFLFDLTGKSFFHFEFR